MARENSWDFVLSFIIDEHEQEQQDKLYLSYMQDVDNCMAYYGEDIETAIKAIKMIVKDINQHGHNVEVCDLFDLY